MKNLAGFVSKKYLQFKQKDRNISLMIKVCFLGILIGTFSLMLTLIIMNGFEKTIHEKMQGINSQIIIYSPGNKLDYENLKNTLLEEFDQLEAISASSTRQVLISKNKIQSILFLKGVDPQNEGHVTNIEEKIIFPIKSNANSLKNLLQNNQIIIGYKTAKHFNLNVGDQINLLIPEPASEKKVFLKKKTAKISAIFKIGLEEYDNNFAFCSLNFIQNIFKEKKGIDQLSLKLKSNNNFSKLLSLQKSKNLLQNLVKEFFKFITFQNQENLIIKKLQKRFPMLNVCSWKDLYPALVASLKLEKYVMFFILALITLVACMTMVSLLFMYIQQKRRDIAIFKSMGLSNKKILSIFLRIGLRITFWASISGLILAAIAGFLLEKYPFIQLPDVYYVSHLPARMDIEIFIIVFICTMFLGFLATWIPAQRTKRINIAQVLRQE
ncbi:FtsX-like permease family protein [Candidatus Dependentiae bacterium]|nr:FtsX-like permease family protein [Candidatus Dependentiae bacterium]